MAQLQQPNIVGNFLSSYATAQDRQREQQDAMYQRERQGRADQMAQQKFDMDMDASQLDMALRRASAMNSILAGVDERDPRTLDLAKQRYLTTFGGRPEDVATITMADIPRIKMQTGQVAEELKAKLLQAQIGTQQAQTRAADALGYQRRQAGLSVGTAGSGFASGDPSGAQPIAGSSNIKLTESQSKDVNFYNRAVEANSQFTDDRIKALIGTKDAVARAIPFAGRKLQSDNSRQGQQVSKNFIAAVLRKDTGAAVTDTEFEFYGDIFIPQWGDDDGTLALKDQARKAFLSGLRKGMSNLAALEQMGIIPPEDLRPLQPVEERVAAPPATAARKQTLKFNPATGAVE